MKVLTDHSAVKAVLLSPNPTGKHARWWTRVYGSGIREVNIVYRSGKENVVADALSRSPLADTSNNEDFNLSVAAMQSTDRQEDITSIMGTDRCSTTAPRDGELSKLQREDPWAGPMIEYIEEGILPEDEHGSMKLVAHSRKFTVLDGILYLVEGKRKRRVVLPQTMKDRVIGETHQGKYGGHFSGQQTYNTLSQSWWWENMYRDTTTFVRGCPHCAIVTGTEWKNRPPLCPIPVQRPFQILGMDIMELPKTESGNKYAIVMQDLFTKWPLVFAAPDQKTLRLAKLIAEEVVPAHGVPEALLTDRGTNLLSHLMRDLCELLGIKKLNTTAYHPECDGLVERFNRTLKTMIRKHVQKFGNNWDRFLPGLLWAYRNVPHDATGEKPSYLLYGYDCRYPTEAALMPPTSPHTCYVDDYRQEMILGLSTARDLAAANIQKAQSRYKKSHDKKSFTHGYKIGQWILIRFPHEESGKNRKLSRPWHGPYRVLSLRGPNVVASKVYFPDDGPIQVHLSRVCGCPKEFPGGFYWYGGRRAGPGRPPKWLDNLQADCSKPNDPTDDRTPDEPTDDVTPEGDATPDVPDVPEVTPDAPMEDVADADPEECHDRVVTPPIARTQTRIITPPDRLMQVFMSLGTSSLKGGSNVRN